MAALRERCQREGWTIVGVIRESGLKGHMDVDERPGMAEALSRAEAGDYDTLLVWDLSRLARSLRLQEQWVWQFGRHGVEILSHTEPHAANTLFRQVMGAFREEQVRDIARRVRVSLRERTRRGVPHGSTPYGYQRGVAHILTPNAHAEVVRRIFQWRADGASLAEIATQLRREGIAGPTGGPWYRTTLTFMLENPAYTGTLCLAELRVPGAHPAIIDEDLWRRVQLASGDRARAPRTKTARSWLEGLIEHACGAPMYLVGGSAGHPSLVFRCRVGAGWGHPDATCQAQPRQIAADRAETLTWQAVTEAVMRLPRSPRTVIARAKEECRRSAPDAALSLRIAQERKKRARERRERIIELYLSGAIDNARMVRELAHVANDEAECNAILARLPNPPDESALIAAWESLRDMRHVLATIAPEHYGRWLRSLGVAVISPAGYTIATGKRGARPDAGKVTIRFRPELAVFLDQ